MRFVCFDGLSTRTCLMSCLLSAIICLASGESHAQQDAAKTIVDGVAENRFLILTHPVVAEHFAKKASDRDRWVGGMRKLRRMLMDMNGGRTI